MTRTSGPHQARGNGSFPARSPETLRICHLGKYYPPACGGMETHVRTLARAQADQGAEVSVICVNHQDPDGKDATWNSRAATKTVDEWDGPVRVIRVGRRASLARLDFCLELPRVLGRLKEGVVDLVHLHVPNPTMLLGLALVRLPCPLLITLHSDIVRQKVLRQALRPFEKRVFNRAARVLSDSPTYPDGSALLRKYRAKLAVLPMGLDLEPFLRPSPQALAIKSRLDQDHGKPLWLSVGRLVYYKGLHVALEALGRVPGKLLVIGKGPLEADLRRRSEDLGVADRVIWHGQAKVEEVIGAYHAATALWFPSNARSEGFGLVQVEAMASGCPVINTAIPASGVPWVSRHEHTGLTIPVDDPPMLARAAQRLLSEADFRGRLGVTGRECACREFDHRLMAERSLAIYHQVLSSTLRRDCVLPGRKVSERLVCQG